jgi:segregation and condensation protein B
MCTKPSCYEDLIRLCHVPKKHVLTDVMLETLAIVAYKQPVTRADIEAIRGVNSDFTINKLLEYHLICELGRLEAPGRPIVFGTTDDFLRSFGVTSLDELPYISKEMVEEFKQEAEEEAEIGI